MECRQKITDALKKIVNELTGEDLSLILEHPTESLHGDYSTNIAMIIAKKQGKSPLGLAEEMAKKMREMRVMGGEIEKIEAAPPGFINFWLSKEVFGRELGQALKEGERHGRRPRRTSGPEGRSDLNSGKKILVEFAHPNTHKLFHIGHLRNITLGESVSRLMEFVGFDAVRANYQGDIGLHIAKALWGIRRLGFKRSESLDEKIKFLAKAYVLGNEGYEGGEGKKREIEEINKKLYEGDKELVELWKETRKWSLDYFDRIYKRVGTKFDRLYFESDVAEPGRELVRKNISKVFKKDQGAVIFPGEKYGLHNRVFINSLGLPTYEAKDLGLAQLQLKEFSPDKIIHVVGPEQKGYFEVVFKAIEMVFPELSGVEHHLAYGWVRLKTGKMSSRKGDVIEGEWLLDETKKHLQEKYEMPEDVAEKVAVGAVKYSMLRLHPLSEIAFDIDESIRLDGDSGPYLQYTYARCQSVLQKAMTNGKWPMTNKENLAFGIGDLAFNPEELSLLRHFYKFPEVVQEAAEKFSPNLVCNFLFELAQRYNAFYNKHRILEQTTNNKQQRRVIPDTRAFRLALTEVTGNILKTGLGLLGIHAPEKM